MGMVGNYAPDDLPLPLLYQVSRGLTTVGKDGVAKPDIAEKWKIGNKGKTYAFFLKKNIYFSDNVHLTSNLTNYDFSDVSVERPNKYTILFTLKDNYSPFLVTASRPVLKYGLVGVSDYKVKNIKLNGNFVDSITLVSDKRHKILVYQFYPTEKALKTAFALGEISTMSNLQDASFKNTTFYNFKNAIFEKKINYKTLVTLFYDTSNKTLSSKTLREALSYTIPDSFKEGIRNAGPLSPFSYAADKSVNISSQDLSHAKVLLEKALSEMKREKISLTIDTVSQYKNTADNIANIWKSLGLETKVKIVDKIPLSFEVYLGEFNVPLDPDQYPLWHSNQESNITHYNNLRVDKILEDGRQTEDIEKRKKIYADFQKYILADPPASFLFFPYSYDVTRR